MMKPLDPILVIDLFPEERAQLLDLLAQLSVEEWAAPTICSGWSVKDVALHLLSDDVGLLSRTADFRFPNPGSFDSWEELLAFINHTNDLWVQATRRVSSDLLRKMLKLTGEEVYRFLQTIDLFILGEPVDWAGPDPAPVWFDVAREYTERWLHQQHIRDAINQPGLKETRFFGPVLDTFVRALPHTYREMSAAKGTVVKLVLTGEAGGEWALVREVGRWALYQGAAENPAAVVTMDQDTAWRVFTKGLSRQQATAQSVIEGDHKLGSKVFDTVSIIA